MFSGEIEIDQWHEMGYRIKKGYEKARAQPFCNLGAGEEVNKSNFESINVITN